MFIKTDEQKRIIAAAETKQDGFFECPLLTWAGDLFNEKGEPRYILKENNLILRDEREIISSIKETNLPAIGNSALPSEIKRLEKLEKGFERLERSIEAIKKFLKIK